MSSVEQQAAQLIQNGNPAGALKMLGEALVSNETNELWNDWATAQFACGNLSEAELGYRCALHLDPSANYALVNLAFLLLAQGQFQDSKHLLETHWESLTEEQKQTVRNSATSGDSLRNLVQMTLRAQGGEKTSIRDPLRDDISALLWQIPTDFGGGCSPDKAYVMAYLIRKFHMQVSLDVGVHRGRSFFPQALAHRRYTGGTAYGVDPWSKEAAREHDNLKLKAEIDHFIDATDFDAIYRDVNAMKQTLGVEKHCMLMRRTSAAAADYFRVVRKSFDLIHIDGNHDTGTVMKDVEDYVALLNPQGILVMDDIQWESVQPACDWVSARMPRLFPRMDTECYYYGVFWNVDFSFASTKEGSGLLGDDFVLWPLPLRR